MIHSLERIVKEKISHSYLAARPAVFAGHNIGPTRKSGAFPDWSATRIGGLESLMVLADIAVQ